MKEFTHINKNGNATMVDVSEKKETNRFAVAKSVVVFPAEVMDKLIANDLQTQKGSVFQTAIIAGIMAAKKTGELIPLCHPIGLDKCDIAIELKQNELIIRCSVNVTAKTGVEMEAMLGASVAALTVYDMCKSLSHDIWIREIVLLEKTGGKNDFRR